MSASTLSLPVLQQSSIDPPLLSALFADLEQCAQLRSVVVRTVAHVRGAPPETVTLPAAHAGLVSGALRSVQIRYVHEGRVWCDTLMAGPAGVRLVRICEEDVAASVAQEG